jgi:hypothetical protein
MKPVNKPGIVRIRLAGVGTILGDDDFYQKRDYETSCKCFSQQGEVFVVNSDVSKLNN